jgi:hypothetical protein
MSCKAKAGSLFAVERNVTKLVAFHPARSLKILPHDTQASSHFSAKFPARPKNIRSHQRPDLFRLRSRAGSNLVLPPLRRRAEVPLSRPAVQQTGTRSSDAARRCLP